MSTTVEAALKAAKTALKAGDPLAATRALLPEIKRFPGNARLLTQLAEVQSARTGLPARPFGPHHLQRLLSVRAQAGPAEAAEETQVAEKYRRGLKCLQQTSQAIFQKPFEALPWPDQTRLLQEQRNAPCKENFPCKSATCMRHGSGGPARLPVPGTLLGSG